MHIGLYFGSFNPIHVGHLIIAAHIINLEAVDKVWFVVSPQNPLKVSNTLLNEYHRLHLVRLAIGDNNHFAASDAEFHLPKPSYTIDTLTHLSEKHPQHQFSVIMGSDSFQNGPKWKNWQAILKHYQVLVYQRPGFAVDAVPQNVRVLDAPLLQISATHLRELIRSKKSIKYLVPDVVEAEIMRERYYSK